MLHTGLCSITFRQLAPAEIVALVARAGLEAIEWGGDVHVPPGRPAAAGRVRDLTLGAGLRVSSYGSYYRAGFEEPGAFSAVLESAATLGAPLIRVWAGRKGSAEADRALRARVVEDLRRAAGQAADQGIRVAVEYHRNTLTDTDDSARSLLAEVGHPNLWTYWQPNPTRTVEDCLEGLSALSPRLSNLHVFSWRADYSRMALAEGADAWRRWLAVPASTGRDHGLLIEFVADDSPERFLEDARTLRSWVEAPLWR